MIYSIRYFKLISNESTKPVLSLSYFCCAVRGLFPHFFHLCCGITGIYTSLSSINTLFLSDSLSSHNTFFLFLFHFQRTNPDFFHKTHKNFIFLFSQCPQINLHSYQSSKASSVSSSLTFNYCFTGISNKPQFSVGTTIGWECQNWDFILKGKPRKYKVADFISFTIHLQQNISTQVVL